MENKADNMVHKLIKNEVLLMERNAFAVRIIVTTVGYAGITYWLNSIRANASIMVVWALIIIQFLLYFSIFIAGHIRAIICGFNKKISLIIFITLAFLGRVNDWELAIIPLTVFVMLIVSAKAKNVSDESKYFLPEK